MYEVTEAEIEAVVNGYVATKNPLVFTRIPSKEKRKYIVFCMVVHAFEKDRQYSEREVNAILKPMFIDYAMIRRYLIDYRFIERTVDGSSYWLSIDLNKLNMFKIN